MALYITAGHSTQRDPWLKNPADPGATHGQYKEADLTVEFRDLLVKELKALGLDPMIDDNRASWPAYLAWARNIFSRDDMLLDIHFNSLKGAPAYGSEIYIAEGAHVNVKEWAAELVENCAWVLGTANRGVKYPYQSARGDLEAPKMTDRAALIEVCFITNQADMDKYNLHKKDLARALAFVIDKHY